MTATPREFDIVLYGATGFAGKLTAEYLARAGKGARIALAGRSTERLLAIRDTLGESAQSWPVLAADASSPSTLNEMAARTQVVVTTVGPYARYGLPLVAACAAAGTDYADLTGEATFIRESIGLYHKQAADTGARIVHSCGFDSIPSDLSVYALYRAARDDGAGELGRHQLRRPLVLRRGIRRHHRFDDGRAGRRLGRPRPTPQLADPYTLSTDRGAEPELGRQPDLPWRRGRQIAPELTGVWTAGFLMALDQHPNRATQQRITRLGVRPAIPLQRTHERRVRRRWRRWRPPSCRGSATRRSDWAAATSGCCRAGWLERVVPKPGTGPSADARERGYYRIETYTTTTSGARYVARMEQQGDPGYKATSVLLGECGLALALDRDKLSDLRGVLTPAAAMGEALLARFPAAGVSLQTERLN